MAAAETHRDPNQLIRYYGKWAAGAGVIPMPLVDLAAVTGVQIKMLRRLAKTYSVDYDESSGKALIGALIGALLPAKLGYGGVGSLLKAVPGVGTLLGIAVMPTFNYASTVAIGRVFQKHFVSGGTLLDFDADAVKSTVVNEYRAVADEAKGAVGARKTATS